MQHLWHTARNEAIAIGGKGRLITSLYLQNSVWTVEQAVHFTMKYYKGIYFRSNCLGWFACYTTQFLTDLFKDPFLSSVIPMVTPTRCHRANWGNPFVGDCGQTWFQISEFTHFNLAIRLSKAKQLAFRFFTVFREFPRLLWSQGFLAAALLRLWSRAEQSETPFLLQLQLLKWDITMSHEQPFRQAHDF